jgi:hypothetical protein
MNRKQNPYPCLMQTLVICIDIFPLQKLFNMLRKKLDYFLSQYSDLIVMKHDKGQQCNVSRKLKIGSSVLKVMDKIIMREREERERERFTCNNVLRVFCH